MTAPRIEMRCATNVTIDCPVCKCVISLPVTVVVLSAPSAESEDASRVAVYLASKESSATHICWPPEPTEEKTP